MITPREPAERSVNAAAYDLYLRGQHLVRQLTVEAVTRGIDYLERSIATAPDFAPAFAALAEAYVDSDQWGQLQLFGNNLADARRLAETAVRIDPRSGEARLALGRVEYASWHWREAEAEFQATIAINANLAEGYLAYARLLTLYGRHDEAIALAERSVLLAPLSTRTHDDLGRTLYRAGRYGEALTQHLIAQELDPAYEVVIGRLIDVHIELGQCEEALGLLKQTHSSNRYQQNVQGRVYAQQGNVRQAQDVAVQLAESKWPWSLIARIEIYSRIGEFDLALDLLEAAVKDQSVPPYTMRNPCHLTMLNHPRYVSILRSVGLIEG